MADGTPGDLLKQWQSETAAIREAPEPLAMRVAVLALAAMIAVCVLVTMVVRVDRVVTSIGGTIVPTEPPIVIQALGAAVIKSINVREGQEVAKDQVLATLDPTFAEADVVQLSKQLAGLNAQIERAEAEQADIPLTFKASDADSGYFQSLQRGLYDQRRAQFVAQLKSFDEKSNAFEATIAKFKADEKSYGEREKIARQIEDMRNTLLQREAGSLLNLLTSTDARMEMLRTIENQRNGLAEAQHSLSSLLADRDAFSSQWQAALSQELVTARSQRDATVAQLAKAQRYHDLVNLTAYESAVVLSMAKLSVGSVLKEGDVLATLMPLRVPMEAELKISARDVAFLRPGDPCRIEISAFNAFEHGTAEGELLWISEGAFNSDDDGRPVDTYYKARVRIVRFNFTGVPSNFRLIPGMTLTGHLKVGSRSLFRYFIGAALHGVGESMREP